MLGASTRSRAAVVLATMAALGGSLATAGPAASAAPAGAAGLDPDPSGPVFREARTLDVCADDAPIRARLLAGERTARMACDLTGRTVTTSDGLAVRVPGAGGSVTASAARVDGPPISLTVSNVDGLVSARRQGTPAADIRSQRPEANGPACRDSRYAFSGDTWQNPVNWRFHGRTTPKRFTHKAVRRHLQAAAANVARARDDCGLKGRPAVYQIYRGAAKKPPNIDADGRCLKNDPVSSIGFGTLGEGRLAVTCVWSTGGRSYTADVRIAPRGDLVLGIRAGCRRKYDLQSFMTHEFGTIFGLANVESRTLTMGAYVLPCTDRLRSLGRGDELGIKALYGER